MVWRPAFGADGFGRAARDVILALVVMNSAVFLWQGARIEKDCLCSRGGSVAIQWVAGLSLAGFSVLLIRLAVDAWHRRGPLSLRAILTEERHHIVAAIVPWITTILGILLLTVPSQTADMLAGIQGKFRAEVGWALAPFAVGAFAWGMATWFCGRWAIDIERRESRRPETWLALWNPRVTALLTGFAIIIVTVKAAGLCSVAMVAASVVAGIVFLIAVFRRPIARLFNPAWRSGGAARLAAARQAGKGRAAEFVDDMRAAPGGPIAVLLVLAISVTVICGFAADPEVARYLQAPGTVLLGIGCLTMIATFLSKAGLRLARFPVLLSCLLVTTLLGRWDIGVNHDIRTLRVAPVPAIAREITLDAAAAEWLTICGASLVDPRTNVLKVVLVSTAGGASRAALWTLNALSDLQDEDAQFPRRVFTVSAVSGGALGATVWSALLANDNFDCTAEIKDKQAARQRRENGQLMLGHDFLAPVLAAWLSRDVTLGVVPLNSLLREIGIKAEDRSTALEQAWEHSWATNFPGKANLFEGDFLSLWGKTFNRPLLLLNGTVEDTGQPIVTAPIAIVDHQGKPYGDLPATYDGRWLLGRDIRTSTAVLNAARFPVVTSQGDIRVRRCADGSLASRDQCPDGKPPAADMISIVDGGYFDNIGGGTTVRAAYALRHAFDRSELAARGVTLRIMVVGINSDPDRLISAGAWKFQDPEGTRNGVIHDPVDQLMRCGQASSTLTIGEKGLGNTLDAEIAPVLAIVATQSGHTALRMAELNQMFCAEQRKPSAPSNYIMLSLCPIGDAAGTVSLPLNWVLPQATLDLFAAKPGARWDLTTQCGNRPELDDYKAWTMAN